MSRLPASSSSSTQIRTQLENNSLPVRHGDLVVVRGDGMPIYEAARMAKKRKANAGKPPVRPYDEEDKELKRGDLYITFEIEMPTAEWLASVDAKVRVISPLSSLFFFVSVSFLSGSVFTSCFGHSLLLSGFTVCHGGKANIRLCLARSHFFDWQLPIFHLWMDHFIWPPDNATVMACHYCKPPHKSQSSNRAEF